VKRKSKKKGDSSTGSAKERKKLWKTKNQTRSDIKSDESQASSSVSKDPEGRGHQTTHLQKSQG